MTVTPVFGAPEGWDAFLLARRRGEFAGPILHATRDDARMARLAEALAFVAAGGGGAALPGLGLPALRPRVAEPGAGVGAHRHAGAPAGKADRGPRIVLTTVNALVQRVPPRVGVRRRQPGAAHQRHACSRSSSPASWRPTATAAPAP